MIVRNKIMDVPSFCTETERHLHSDEEDPPSDRLLFPMPVQAPRWLGFDGTMPESGGNESGNNGSVNYSETGSRNMEVPMETTVLRTITASVCNIKATDKAIAYIYTTSEESPSRTQYPQPLEVVPPEAYADPRARVNLLEI